MAKTAKIMLDKERTLAFPLMALIRLKKEFGIQLQDLEDETKAQDIETILALVWAGLIHEDKDLSFDDLGYMIDLTQLPEISDKLSEIFESMDDSQLKK